MLLPSLSTLTAADLTSSIRQLREKQRADDVEFLWLLAEVDRRQTFAELGFNSLWDYCIGELRLSNGAAWRRITAARLLARFPTAAAYLADGRLNLSTLGKLRDALTEENHLQLFEEASFKSEADVEHLVRTRLPLRF